jgi:hypothetical protein
LSFNAQIKAPFEFARIQPGSASSAGQDGTVAENSGERASLGCRMIGFHDFRYPGSQFRVSLFAGCTPQATSLVRKAYSRLGYATQDEERMDCTGAMTASLHAVHRQATLGALSVNLDGESGLRAEALYPLEVAELRLQGALCEFTQLAMDTELAGREVLCSLFYMAYVFSHAVHGAANLLIEVNPRHQCFYERMLGFRRIGDERICQRVGAPAVLLHLDFDFTRRQIERARQGLSVAGTTLYRYAAPLIDEQSLIRRMTAATL